MCQIEDNVWLSKTLVWILLRRIGKLCHDYNREIIFIIYILKLMLRKSVNKMLF